MSAEALGGVPVNAKDLVERVLPIAAQLQKLLAGNPSLIECLAALRVVRTIGIELHVRRSLKPERFLLDVAALEHAVDQVLGVGR